MQRVSHEYRNVSELLDLIDDVYYYTSDYDEKESNRLFSNKSYPESFKGIFDIFETYGYSFNPKYKPFKFNTVDLESNNKVVVCVSGGKDSTATALHYKELGYDVYLFHLIGINKCYPDEYKSVENIANYLSLPIRFERIKLTGNHMYIEHPLKNYIIMNAAINYAKEIETCNIAMGDFNTAYLEDNKFEVCGGDTVEMWNIYRDIVKDTIPNFNLMTPIENVNESMNAFKSDKELLKLSQSCIGTFRFREYKGNLIREKFKYDLMPHRCGSCWKCALEYIYYTDSDVLEFNEMYYKYCLTILLNYTVRHGETPYTIYDLWNEYLFYDIEDSKLEGIEDAIIQCRKIKYIKNNT